VLSSVAGVGVYVSDVDMAVDFWVERLGFAKRSDATYMDMRWVEVAAPGAQTALVLVCGWGDWTPEKVGGFTGILLQATDVPKLHRYLVDQGVAIVEEPAEMPWGTQMQFSDPDGNIFVVQG
jgi:predicted enzyme related to lactoylglutathione lyase